jgi:thiol-disulfide isomerase/thioredoxin
MLRHKLSSLLLAVLCLLGAGRSLHAQLAVGDAFPALEAMGLEGKLPATGGQVLLVDFWASWCAPCKASFPSLAKMHNDYSARGVVVLGVSVDQSAGGYASFLKKHAPPFATVRDAGQKLVATVKVPTMPTSYVIGRDGRITAIHTGYHGEASDRALRAALDQALAQN